MVRRASYSQSRDVRSRAADVPPTRGQRGGYARDGAPALCVPSAPDLADPLCAFGTLPLLGRGFRPRLLSKGLLSSASRREISGAYTRRCKRCVRWRGDTLTLPRLVARQAANLTKLFRGDADAYSAFRLRW